MKEIIDLPEEHKTTLIEIKIKIKIKIMIMIIVAIINIKIQEIGETEGIVEIEGR